MYLEKIKSFIINFIMMKLVCQYIYIACKWHLTAPSFNTSSLHVLEGKQFTTLLSRLWLGLYLFSCLYSVKPQISCLGHIHELQLLQLFTMAVN